MNLDPDFHPNGLWSQFYQEAAVAAERQMSDVIATCRQEIRYATQAPHLNDYQSGRMNLAMEILSLLEANHD